MSKTEIEITKGDRFDLLSLPHPNCDIIGHIKMRTKHQVRWGILAKVKNSGNYVQVNAGVMRMLDQNKVKAALAALD